MGSLLNLVQRARGAQLDFDITKLSDAELLQLIVKVSVAWLNKDRRRTGTEPVSAAERAALTRGRAVDMATISGRSPPWDLNRAAELLSAIEMSEFTIAQLGAVAEHPAFAELQQLLNRRDDRACRVGDEKREIELAIEAGSASPIEMVLG